MPPRTSGSAGAWQRQPRADAAVRAPRAAAEHEAQHDQQQLVQVGVGVVAQHRPAFAFRFAKHLRPPLADAQEEGQEGGEDIQPGREDIDFNQGHAGRHPQHIEGSQPDHVNDGRVLEP